MKLNKVSSGVVSLIQVIFETSRLATIVNGVLRKTTQDMELNGELNRSQSKLNKIFFIEIAPVVFLWAQEAVLQIPSLFANFCTK